MGARKLEKFPVQLLALTAIVVDHAIQSRVSTSMEYQREFSEAMLRGDVFPPVVVFQEGNKFWLADGFHRYGAAVQAAKANPKLKGAIRAEVREGTRRDAMVFSAGANIKFSIPRTWEDIKKAVWMLLEDESWFNKASNAIAKHCGIANHTVQKHRSAFCEAKGIQMPAVVEGKDGVLVRSRKVRDGQPFLHKSRRSRDQQNEAYSIFVKGKEHFIGHDKETAERQLKSMTEEWNRRKLDRPGNVRTFLIRNGVDVKAFDLPITLYPSLHGFTCGSFVCTSEGFVAPGDAITAISRALLLKQYLDSQEFPAPERCQVTCVGNNKPIVVCYPNDGPSEILKLGRQLGIEFLTPEELIARVKGESPPSDSSG